MGRDVDWKKVLDIMREELRSYCDGTINALVLGISGGIDSAVCAAIAKPVCEELNIPLMGRSIPLETNKGDEIVRSRLVGRLFCTDFHEVKMELLMAHFMEDSEMVPMSGNFTHEQKIRRGNIKARMRMIYLYDLANKHKGMVLSTDNLTEFLLGFWTLHGDVGDFGLIQSLWKTEVYQLAEYLKSTVNDNGTDCLDKCITAVPTDGLGITDSDFEQLGATSYEEIDSILQRFYEEDSSTESYKELTNHPVIKRHLATEWKRDNPLNLDWYQLHLDRVRNVTV